MGNLARLSFKTKSSSVIKYLPSLLWWLLPVILALERQRQADFCEFKASLVYRVSSRIAKAHRETLSQKNRDKNKQKPI